MDHLSASWRLALQLVAIALLGVALWLSVESHNESHSAILALRQQTVRLRSDEEHARLASASNVEAWCQGINRLTDYERSFANQTLAQTEAQARAFARALAGPTSLGAQERGFIELFLRSVVRLEQSVPSVTQLHRFALADLDCKSLISRTLRSAGRPQTHPPLVQGAQRPPVMP